jgi:tetratricopeptide (TPR) repeat protein
MDISKKTIYLSALGGLVIIAAAFVAFKEKPAVAPATHSSNIIHRKIADLTSEEKALVDKRLSDANKSIAAFNSGATAEVKFNAYMQGGFQEYILGNYDDSLDFYKKAVDTGFDEFNATRAIFQTRMDMRDYIAAETDVKNLTKLRPDEFQAWLSYIRLEKDNLNMSNRDVDLLYNQALEKTHDNVNIISAYALYLESVGNNATALELLQKAVKANPKYANQFKSEIDKLKMLTK